MRKTLGAICCAALLTGLIGCSCLCGKVFCHQEHADESRAGFPSEVSPHAKPSDDGGYVAYRVGGGAACEGDEPGPHDGTWGWDYQGCWWPSRVILGWWHGRKCQDGAGQYQTDGPRPCQDLKEMKEE